MELARVHELSGQVLDEVERAVVGKRDSLELVLVGFLGDGHVLLEDYSPRSGSSRHSCSAGPSWQSPWLLSRSC